MTNMNSLKNLTAKQAHPFHLVEVSPWPILMSFSIFTGAVEIVSWLGGWQSSGLFAIAIALVTFLWWRDVVREAKGGFHTLTVQRGLLIGFLLFLISEVMLFISFFWSYFHSSLAPAVELGCTWPPVGINSVSAWNLPLVGTCILLASGFILTHAHHALILGNKDSALVGFFFTVLLGVVFLCIQYTEYVYSEYTIADSVYGSSFFCLTGLHGVHVVAGTLFLAISMIRIYLDNITSEHHLGVEFAIYYWHLVDIVWIVLFLIVYWWGGN